MLAYDELAGIDWSFLSMDGAMTKAPLGGDKTGPNPTDRGKSGTKRSVLTDARGTPLGIQAAGANKNDFKLVRPTIQSVPTEVERPEPTEQTPQGLCLDKGYDYPEVEQSVVEAKLTPHIRRRGEEKSPRKQHPGGKARRWVMERTHSWMNRFRRILVRWEKREDTYLAMLCFVCGLICLSSSLLGCSAWLGSPQAWLLSLHPPPPLNNQPHPELVAHLVGRRGPRGGSRFRRQVDQIKPGAEAPGAARRARRDEILGAVGARQREGRQAAGGGTGVMAAQHAAGRAALPGVASRDGADARADPGDATAVPQDVGGAAAALRGAVTAAAAPRRPGTRAPLPAGSSLHRSPRASKTPCRQASDSTP